jgi:hypothetical protein
MKWLWKLLWIFSGENRLVIIEQLYQAISSGELTVVNPPEGGWYMRQGHLRLANTMVNIFYLETGRADGKKAESIELTTLSHRVGVRFTLVDDKVTALQMNALEHEVSGIHPDDLRRLHQIAYKIRYAVGNYRANNK